MSTWYHGTTARAAEQIRREGFRVGTWFARQEQTAQRYGPVVLRAELDEARMSMDVTDQCHTLVPVRGET